MLINYLQKLTFPFSENNVRRNKHNGQYNVTDASPQMVDAGMVSLYNHRFMEAEIQMRELDGIVVFDGKLHFINDLLQAREQSLVIAVSQTLLSEALDQISDIIKLLQLLTAQSEYNGTHPFQTYKSFVG